MADRIDVMISSTARDLPDHRQHALDACLRQGMHPIMMEHLPAADKDAIDISLEMVEEAEIYLGIFAHRYGYIPDDPRNPDRLSITEMEYRRAKERDIPRLLFLMGDEHPVKRKDIETEPAALAKLEKLKEDIGKERVVNFFNSAEELRSHIINSLSHHRQPSGKMYPDPDIPQPPAPFIAHPYTLLPTRLLHGRQPEMNLLADWVTRPNSRVYQARILNFVAIGGMGKSALTWKWFNEIAPQEMKPLAGRLWWSFYESDATFENFIIHALAYVTRQSKEHIRKNTKPGEREDQLLRILNEQPYLFVLDGLERILIAYARMDAAYLADDELDSQTANYVAQAYGLPESAADSFIGQHQLRKCADPRAGNFLRKLTQVKQSRILVSTRLYPAELQTAAGGPLPGSFAAFLTGLRDDDALALWRDMGLAGSRDKLLELFNRFENYPLLIRTLATPVAEYRKAPGDFDAWYAANPDVNPAQLPMVQVKSHVLAYAMHGLTAKQRVLLNTVAAFRAPTDYATIRDLVLEDQRGFFARLTGTQSHKRSLYSSEVELDDALRELEDRGLLGWDRLANRYDLHPIVRGVTWGGLDEDSQQAVYARLHGHFESVPDKHSSWREVESIEDLAPAIELYSTLIGLGRYDDACDLFDDRLDDATLYRLSASRQRIELLEMLFPAGTDSLPPLSRPDMQAYTLNALAQAYQFNGQPGLAAPLFRRNVEIREANGDNFSVGLCNLSDALRLAGGLHEAEGAARRALHLTREQANHFLEAASLDWLGLALAALGRGADGRLALRRARHIFQQQNHRQMEGVTEAYLAQAAIWANDLARARRHANRAWELAPIHRVEGDFIRSARLQGEAAVTLDDPDTADERLHHALTRARAVNRAEDELPALVALAEMYRRQGDVARAREMLSDVWEGCERGPYPPFHADGLNALARLEQDAGNPGAAVEAATAAYQKAWCDGPPYAYHSGLENAKALLTALGAPLPEMPPFDPAKFEPMVEVEVNPRDEFYVAVDDES